ncbi:hypothetical protein [Actinokineospora sp. HUAS TT18]|uniref:hypothetical protein n=1 Tax=Actinokineospora sp. HUAS TT18 TaxID=3447451 RepID=UPI003F51F7AE
MTTSLTAAQLARYRAARAAGHTASTAHGLALASTEPRGADWEINGDLIRFTPHAWGDRTDLQITATAAPDPHADLTWLGEFSATWAPGAIVASPDSGDCRRYFHPTITIDERRAALAASGHARGVAHHLALNSARADLDLARTLVGVTVTASVAHNRAEVFERTMGGVFLHPDEDSTDYLISVIAQSRMVEDLIGWSEILFGLRPSTTHLTPDDTWCLWLDTAERLGRWATVTAQSAEERQPEDHGADDVTSWNAELHIHSTGSRGTVDHDAILAALRRIADEPDTTPLPRPVVDTVIRAVTAPDHGEAIDALARLDAPGRDAVIQLAVLGEITHR